MTFSLFLVENTIHNHRATEKNTEGPSCALRMINVRAEGSFPRARLPTQLTFISILMIQAEATMEEIGCKATPSGE